MKEKRTLTEVVRAYGLERLADSERHPTPGELASYLSRRLDQDGSEAVMEHLSLCARCAASVQELAAVGEQPRRSGRQPFWRGFRGAPLYVTAALAVVCLAAVLWGVALRDRLRTLDAAEHRASAEELREVSLLEFTPRALNPIRGPEGGGLVKARSGGALVLVLHTTQELKADGYTVEVLGPAGRLLYERHAAPTPEGSFVLLVPAGLEAPGRYAVRLIGIEDGVRLELETFELEVFDGD